MKCKFKLTRLSAAMAIAVGGLGAATPTLAVNLSDNGLGDVGVSPYYTVRNNIATNLTVVNTSPDYVVAFKIRFREGDNSRDARDFNVFLSPNDVWTATISVNPDDDDDPTNDVPRLITPDQSCTAPILERIGETADGRAIRSIDFTNIAYAGGSTFPVDTDEPELLTIERAQEGHFEVIEMGVARPGDSVLANWAVHTNNPTTLDCAKIVQVYTGDRAIDSTSDVCGPTGVGLTGNLAFKAEYCEPLNVLKVSANLIQVDKGVAGGIPVEMLANFYNPNLVEDYLNPDPDDLMEIPQSEDPNLNDALPPQSVQITEDGAVTAFFADPAIAGANAVSSLFAATDVINEYAVGCAAVAQNAWVLTFPTKWFYVDVEEDQQVTLPVAPPARPNPFQEYFPMNGVSCVTVDFEYYNREEVPPGIPPGGLEPSPPPVVDIPEDSICQETQILNFGDQSLLGSKNNYFVPLEDGFSNGWMRLGFPDATWIEDTAGLRFYGLPVIGFSLKTLENGVAGDNTLNYGVVTEHAYLRFIEPAPVQ